MIYLAMAVMNISASALHLLFGDSSLPELFCSDSFLSWELPVAFFHSISCIRTNRRYSPKIQWNFAITVFTTRQKPSKVCTSTNIFTAWKKQRIGFSFFLKKVFSNSCLRVHFKIHNKYSTLLIRLKKTWINNYRITIKHEKWLDHLKIKNNLPPLIHHTNHFQTTSFLKNNLWTDSCKEYRCRTP